MAKSKAKKLREHLARNGHRDPAASRADRSDFSTHVRKTPTLRDRTEKQERKHRSALLHAIRWVL